MDAVDAPAPPPTKSTVQNSNWRPHAIQQMPDPEERNADWSRSAAFGAIGTTFAGTVFFVAPFILMPLKSPLPYMSTPTRKVVAALERVSSRLAAKRRGKDRFVFNDLGSGDGGAVLAAARSGWHATGVEMNWSLYCVSQARRWLSPRDVRLRSRFILGDMFSHDIGSADAVMVFGVRPLMPKIHSKILAENPGVHLMSYRFIPPVDRHLSQLIFDEEEMRVWDLGCKERVSKVNDLE